MSNNKDAVKFEELEFNLMAERVRLGDKTHKFSNKAYNLLKGIKQAENAFLGFVKSEKLPEEIALSILKQADKV